MSIFTYQITFFFESQQRRFLGSPQGAWIVDSDSEQELSNINKNEVIVFTSYNIFYNGTHRTTK